MAQSIVLVFNPSFFHAILGVSSEAEESCASHSRLETTLVRSAGSMMYDRSGGSFRRYVYQSQGHAPPFHADRLFGTVSTTVLGKICQLHLFDGSQ